MVVQVTGEDQGKHRCYVDSLHIRSGCMTTSRSVDSRPTAARTGPRKTLWTLRITAILTTIATMAQPVLAGYYLDGSVNAIQWHETNAHIVQGLGFIQLIVALLYWKPGGGRGWPLLFNVLLWFAVGFQIGMGYGNALGIHAPLGVLIAVLQVGFTVWACSRLAARARPRKERA